MAIPAALDSLLREHNIQYDLQDHLPNTALPQDAVRAVLLADGEQRFHVLFPAHSLLDLNAVRQQTGLAQLRAMAVAEVNALCESRNFQQVPALPCALGVATLVDRKLLANNGIALVSGNDGLVRLRTEQFQQSLDQAVLGNFSIDITELQHGKLDAVDDVEAITHAVANFTQLRLKQRLQETLEIPPLPDTAQRILKLRVDPNADVRNLTTLVETDPPLAAQVVSWASSPYYAYTGKIKSVHDAIVRVLGFDVVLNLALGMSLGKSLSLPKDSPAGFTTYWQQAVYCATAVESLVGCIAVKHRPIIGIAYLSGLLHNFGHLVMAEIFPPYFSSYCRLQEVNPQLNYTTIERHLLGITRDQMAGWLMRMWSMPDEVCTGVRFQNEAEYAGENSAYANLIFIAMRLLRRHGIGNAPLESIPQEMFERLQLDPDKAVNAIQNVVDASQEIIGQM
ncbi:MAG: histidine kinase [Verrucomicrobiaceae bacterium]|nr:histidine kinase [Verrucomicrobiaceae bacterium]